MSSLFLVFLSLSVSGSLLALMVFLAQKLLHERFSKRWHYYIWLVVVLRLLVPLAPEGNLMGYLLGQLSSAQNGPNLEGASPGVHENVQLETGVAEMAEGGADESGDAPIPEAPRLSGLSAVRSSLWIIWLAGAAAFLLKRIADYNIFCMRMKRHSIPGIGRAPYASYQALCAELNIRRTPPVRIGGHLSTPMLVGLFRPFIVMPLSFLDGEASVEYAMRHELIHYKRGDMAYKWLVQLARCLHWYNPLAALIPRTVNRYCELSCDEAVIRGMDEEQKYRYGEILLATVQVVRSTDAVASFPMSADARQIKERLDSIMQSHKRSKRTTCLSLFLAIVLTLGATAMGAYAATPSQSDSELVSTQNTAGDNPVDAVVMAYLGESLRWQEFLQRAQESGERSPSQTDTWPQYMAYRLDGATATSMGNGFAVSEPIQVRLSVEYVSGRMQELRIEDGDGQLVFGIPTLGSGQYEFNLYPTENTHKLSMELTDYVGNVLIENIGPAAEPLDAPFTTLEITPQAFRVQRYGSFPLAQDQPVNLQLNWDGDAPVIFLYTAADYGDQELIEMLQAGLQGLSLGDFRSDYTYRNNPTMYLAANALGTMSWERTSAEDGTFAVYLLLADEVENLQGSVQFGDHELNMTQR